ncbi:MAG: peptidoglycan DD-metalloendopeptidase family protein [Thermoanaerobaculales bacterium]|nr:peptidoglycan DD-metalloendopeptidase family protein [Thermoanaerobaculales bacterium]
MAKRLNTVIIVPHSKANFIKFSFSSRTFFGVAALGVLTFVLSLMAIGFTGNAVDRRAEVDHLQEENRELQQANDLLEQTILEVQERLDDFEERTARLALGAGIEPESTGVTAGDGGSHSVSVGGPFDRLPEDPESLKYQGDWIAEKLLEVEQTLTAQGERFACTPSIAPVVGLITDGFGRRRDPINGRMAFHRGLDLSGRRGTPIMAPADGVVVFAARNGGMGRMVKISHGFGFTTAYGHLDKILVEPGQEVHRGDEIGHLGNTGRSTGPHLHYEVSKDGKHVNPLYYILDAY